MKTKKSETKGRKPAAPKATREYDLIMYSDSGDSMQEIHVTRTEHKALKEHLASIRKSKPAGFVADDGDDPSATGVFELPGVEAQEFDWLKTPADSGYKLEMWDTVAENCDEEIHVTREEYVALKHHLATLRGLPVKRAA